MKTIIGLLLAAPGLVVGIHLRLAAQESAPASTGKVLVLTSERILEGDIERIGARYRIRRGASEVLIAADSALWLCADLQEACKYMRNRANLGDPDERLRLARWCQLNNLREEALAEARFALELRPEHAVTKNLVAVLERTLNNKTPALTPPSVQKPASTPAKAASPLDINAESLAQFTQKVQPILMNACARCHANGQEGDFQLQRSHEGGQRSATQKNLAAVLAQIHVQKPALSPLLVKAVSAHGDAANAPIRSQQAVPFRTMAEWIDRTLATNPHLRERTPPPVAKNLPEPLTPVMQPTKPAADPKTTVVSRSVERVEGSESTTKAPETAAPLDPFDPEIFNRQARSRK